MKRKLGRMIALALLGAVLMSGCGERNEKPTEETTASADTNEEETVDMMEVIAEVGFVGETPKLDVRKSKAERKYFTGTTNKDAVAYETGEDMWFTINLLASGEKVSCPKFRYTVAADDGRTPTVGYVEGVSGTLTLGVKLGVPGFVHVQVEACDENGEPIKGCDIFDGGAGADIEKIQKLKTEPADFDAFWSAQLKTLDATAPDPIEIREVTSPQAGFTVYAVKIRFSPNNTWGDYAAGYLSVPTGAKLGSLSLCLTLNGAGTFDPSIECAQGRATLCLSPHSLELGQSEAYYNELREGKLKGYGFNETYNAARETVYFREMILRDVQAMRFLKTYFSATGTDARFCGLWDGKNLTLSGGSQGGMQCAAVAALEPGATFVQLYCPWFCDVGGCGTDGRQGSTYMPKWTEALEYYDSVNFAKRITCKVTIVSAGLGDYVATPAGITAFYNNLGSSVSKKITYVQNCTHSYNPVERKTYTRSHEAAQG